MKKEIESKIISKINYEFRDSLNAILGMTNIIDRTDDIEKINDSVKKIKQTAQDLLQTINSILELSNKDSIKMGIELKEFNTEEMFSDVFDIIEFAANEKNIKIEIDILDNNEMLLLGDAKKLGQVYINLLSNAIKFTEKGRKSSRIGEG